jgi:hypothetical protein
MKRSIISLLVVAVCAGTTATALAQNGTAGDKPGETQVMTTDQKEMSPSNRDQGGMTNPPKGDSATSPKDGAQGAAAFKEADKDNDGTLDRKEAKAMPHVDTNFDAIDTDKDGTVSLAEIHTYNESPVRRRDPRSHQELGRRDPWSGAGGRCARRVQLPSLNPQSDARTVSVGRQVRQNPL